MSREKPILISIIGMDGVGKTTHARKIVKKLRNDGVRCRYTWFRFFHFSSLLLLAYCRLAGLTIYEIKNGVKIGRHEFYRSKFISFLYPWLLLIDMLPMYFIKIFLPKLLGYTVVCDRFIYDAFVDLRIDIGEFEIGRKNVGEFFIQLIPKDTRTILLDLDESIIRERRKDLVEDQSLERRRKEYYRIAHDFNIPIINNEGNIEEINNLIIQTLGYL